MEDISLPDLPTASDGSKLLPSYQKNEDGSARFVMVLPAAYYEDPGLSLLARSEALHCGYEFPYRRFLDQHLRAGDLFIDIGAHFGIYALSAASAPAGEVRVIAVEPDPHNVRVLKVWAAVNKRAEQIEILEAACGASPGRTRLWSSSTMGHQVGDERPEDTISDAPAAEVEMLTIDGLLRERSELAERRVFLKIDVEGIEPEVLEGARETLGSGRVAAVIFEKSEAYASRERSAALERVSYELRDFGFDLWWFPHLHMPSVLMPWISGDEAGNILAIGPALRHSASLPDLYDGPACSYFSPPPALSECCGVTYDDDARADFTEKLIEAKASDGWRWCRPTNLQEGAEDRAAMVAEFLPQSGSLIDVGAGTMELFRALPISVRYTPLDLVRYSKVTVLADLNQGHFPDGHWDFATVLEVLEFIHDAPELLHRLRNAADRLILTYRTRPEGRPNELKSRRQAGFVNDFTADELRDLLQTAEWQIEELRTDGNITLVLAS